MHLAVYLTLLVAAGLVPAALSGCPRLAPRAAAGTLVAAAAAAAAGWVGALAMLAATLADAAPGGASVLGFRMASDPVPWWVAAIALLLLAAACVRLAAAAGGALRRVRANHAALSACRAVAGELLVVADPHPVAYALPSLVAGPGRIVVSTGMLAALDAEQRAVLLAHERSHLRNRHSWLRGAMTLAVAAHPLCSPLGAQLDTALERWADEDSAGAVSSRRAAARSVGGAALAALKLTPPPPAPTRGTAARPRRPAAGVPARVAALCGEAPRSNWLPAVAIAALLAVMVVTATEATRDLETLFDPGSHVTAGPSS
ncbi:MAG TPA: M56 family metallopeptidase [Candidatus Dormibacteraeota bacterium]|nr:M56 family metallopeptidase [Candidatus Dormibacteraeota bacterium]